MVASQTVLDSIRVLSNAIDAVHDMVVRLESLGEEHGREVQRFQVQDDNQDTIRQMLEELPPKRAAALTTALMDLSKLVPADEQEAERLAAKTNNDLKLLKRIRANLHIALGDDEI